MPGDRLKIVHVTCTPRGAPWMVALMREQQKRGHDVAAILPSLDGDIAEALAKTSIPSYVAPTCVFSVRGAAGKARGVVTLAALLRRLRPDVVHSHILEGVVSARLAAWLVDVPLRFGGNVAPISIESELMRPLEIGTAFCDTHTIASCRHTRDLFIQHGVPADQVELIYYAVDQSRHDPALADGARVRRELGIPADVPVVGKVAYFYQPATAALFPQWDGRGLKGHDVLLRAVPHVLREVPNARFVLVGSALEPRGAAYEQQMWALARQLAIEHAVLFPGERTDVPDVLASFDISVHCSLTDNLAGTVESLLMERPMVVSDIPGFADTVQNEETGLVVPADDPVALAAAIVRLIRDEPLRRRLGALGRQRMLERFTLARAADDVEALMSRNRIGTAHGYRFSRVLARAARAPFHFLPIAARVRRHQNPSSVGGRIMRTVRRTLTSTAGGEP
jgi:glycosyltransferase involved in cell wall biosynthesis